MSNQLWNLYAEANPDAESSDFDYVTSWAADRIATLEAELLAARDLLVAKDKEQEGKLLVEVCPTTLRIDVYGKAGKSAWDTRPDVFVRATHLPTGLFAESDTERSQHANKAKAIEKLKDALALELTK